MHAYYIPHVLYMHMYMYMYMHVHVHNNKHTHEVEYPLNGNIISQMTSQKVE